MIMSVMGLAYGIAHVCTSVYKKELIQVHSQEGDTPVLPLISSATRCHESLTVLLKVHCTCAVINRSRLF